MTQIRTILAAAITLSTVFAATQAGAVSLQVKMACASDYYAHCSQHAPDSPGVRKCMRAVGRSRTGEGAKVTTNLMHNGVWSHGSMTQAALCGAEFTEPQTRSKPHNPMVNHYGTADGRRFLVLHGDQFDVVMHYAPWLAMLGAHAYSAMLAANRLVGWVRRRLGISYWSLAAWTKRSVKNAVKVIGTYEAALVAEARRSDVDGIICGHIHHAEIRQLNGCCYVNTGDWVESGTAVLEHHDGRLELVHWAAIEGSPSAPGPDHSGLAASDDLADRGLVAAFLALTGDAP